MGDLVTPGLGGVHRYRDYVVVWTRIGGRSMRIPRGAVGIVVKTRGPWPRVMFDGAVYSVDERDFVVVSPAIDYSV